MGAISGFLVDSISVKEQTGVSAFGDPTYGSVQTIKSRVEETTKIIKATNGEEHQASHKIATEELIDINSLVWLPGESSGDDDLARRVLKIETAKTKSGGYQFYMTFVGAR